MMTYLIKFLNRIDSTLGVIITENGNYLYSSKKVLSSFTIKQNKVFLKKKSDLDSLNYFLTDRDNLYTYKPGLIYKLSKGVIINQANINAKPLGIIEDKLYLIFNDEQNTIGYTDLQLKTGYKIFSSGKSVPLKVDTNIIVLKDLESNRIFTSDINTGCQLWEIDLKLLFNTSEQVLIYDNKIFISNNKIFLFAYSRNWNVFSTLILDSQTGNIIYKTQEIGGSLYQYEDKIYCKLLDGIGILDCNSLLVSKISLSSYLHDENLVLVENPMSFYNNFAYITAKKQDSNINSIWLVINLETNTVIHKEEVLQDFKKKSEEGNRTFINDIQVNNKIIAINTTGGVLYVYKKEENMPTS